MKVGKRAALTALTFGLLRAWRKKRGGNVQPARDADNDGHIQLVPSPFDGHKIFDGSDYETRMTWMAMVEVGRGTLNRMKVI